MTPRALEIAKQTCDAWELQLGPLESLIASSLDAYADERLAELQSENEKMSETIAKVSLLLYAAHKALKEIAFAPYRSGPDQDIARAALKGSR